VTDDGWDIFISYSHDDTSWVDTVLCRELRGRLIDDRSPRLFRDNDPDGLKVGSNWRRALADAVQRSTFFLPVYSAAYFASPVCRLEMDWALKQHERENRIIPVLIDPSVQVPFILSPINYLTTAQADWLERLCRGLGMYGVRDRPRLRFHTAPGDVRIDHTLPEQRIGLVGYAPGQDEEDITLDTAPSAGLLRGTTTVTTSGGVAVFRDLSIAAPTAQVRLVARYPGGDQAEGGPFAVHGRRPGRHAQRRAAWFAADSKTVVTLDQEAFDDVPKEFLRGDDSIAVAGWGGLLAVAAPGAERRSYSLGGDGLAVPGALARVEDRLYVGMWNGRVWAVDGKGGEPEVVLDHPAGVQTMAAVGLELLIAGFDGELAWYAADGTPIRRAAHRLEPVLWGLLIRPDCVIAAGAERVHRLDLDTDTVISLRLLPTEATGAVIGGELATVFDGDGHGIRFDSQLEVRGAYHSPEGARPVDMDDAGNVVLTAGPEGSYALMVDDRVVHVNQDGTTAIAPDGRRVALVGVATAGITTCLLDELPAQ
jgi:hypothetical protein